MRGRTSSTIWAIVCTLCMIAGEALAFYFAWKLGAWVAVTQLAGFVVGWILSPIVHEVGHIVMGKTQKMRLVYAKFSFLKLVERKGKLRLRFASPFSTDETQTIPQSGGDMSRRARLYTIGGLLFSGIFLLVVAIAAICLTLFMKGYLSFALLGLLPYGGYLFLLNVLPCEYGGGKTDMRVYQGIKKGEDSEKTMLACMEIQGRLYQGAQYREIDEQYFFDLPQLPEDEPLYAVILDLRYRYFLDIGEMQKAADCLNRLANAQAYLSADEIEKVATELVYMHVLNGDIERANACAQACKEYLQREIPSAKRVLAAVARLGGKTEECALLIEQARTLLKQEKAVGERALEETLLARLSSV